MLNTDFLAIYEELEELYEAKNKSKNNKAFIDNSGPTFSEHIESICTPLNKIIPEMPAEQSGFLLRVTPTFIDDYNALCADHPAPDIDRLHKDIKKVLSLMQKDGKVNHKDLGTERLVDYSDCLGCKWGRLAGTPIRSHVILAHDHASNKKYFIIATLFLHRKERWTASELTAGDSEYSKIYSYFKKSNKKIS